MGGFTVPSQTFLSVDAMSSGLTTAPVSGLMGLAFESLANTGATPFWQALTNDNQLSSPEMSFWLARDPDPTSASTLASGGVFTLGGTNSSLFSGNIEFIDLASTPSFWQLSLSSLTVNGAAVSLSTSNPLSAIDTGTTLIGGPHDDVVSFYNAIPGSISLGNSDPGFYAFPCSTDITVSLNFGGQSWPISPQDFNTGSVSEGRNSALCTGAIFDLSLGSDNIPGSSTPSWIFGDTFLKNVYSVFRSTPPSVGFAQLSTAAGGSGTASAGSSSPTGSSSAMSIKIPAFLMLSTAFTAVIMLCL
jgi:cathepsin D